MNKKRIKILTKGIITVKGFIYGPVLTPYNEDLDTIFKMLSTGVEVVEVLDDGTEVKLDMMNFNADNVVKDEKKTTSRRSHQAEDNKPSEPVVEPTVEEVKEEAPAVEETVTEETAELTTEEVEPVVEPTVEEVKEEAPAVEETVTEETAELATEDKSEKNNYYKNNKHNKYNKR